MVKTRKICNHLEQYRGLHIAQETSLCVCIRHQTDHPQGCPRHEVRTLEGRPL